MKPPRECKFALMHWIRMRRQIGYLGVLTVIWGCQGIGPSQSPAETPKAAPTAERSLRLDSLELIQLGDSLTTDRQQRLLQRLMQVSEKEGWGGAVRYCHIAAETLAFYGTDGLYLQRIAERYRNPKDKLQDSLDQAAFAHFQSTGAKTPIVWKTDFEWRYYRPIYIIMPTCLKCHGSKDDLDALALTEIRRRYPADNATGFRMGDLRGLWKMTQHAQ